MSGPIQGSLRGRIQAMIESGISSMQIRREFEGAVNDRTLDSYLHSLGASEGRSNMSSWWFRGRVAGVHHLVDLKRAGHSPRQTERGPIGGPATLLARPAVVLPEPETVENFLAVERGEEESQHDAHVVAWGRFSMGLVRKEPPVALIVAATARRYGVTADEIKSSVRTARLVRPRQLAMLLCNEMTTLSLPQIGRMMGGRDHTTVLHGIRKANSRKGGDTEYAEAIDAIRTDVESNFCRANASEARP